jgi:hypothetical protein
MPTVLKSGSLKFLEPSEPVQALNGIALHIINYRNSYRLVTGWKFWGSISGGGEIFRTCPDRPWGPPSLLCNRYPVFHGVKATGAWCWPPNPSYRRGREWEELYPYSPSRPLVALYRVTFTAVAIFMMARHDQIHLFSCVCFLLHNILLHSFLWRYRRNPILWRLQSRKQCLNVLNFYIQGVH